MSDELLNILSNSNKDINNQKLMDYVSGNLSGREQHALEEEMLDSELVNDAIEGLSSFQNRNDIESIADELNKNLKKQLKPKRKNKRSIYEMRWIYLSIILILFLIIVGFLVIGKLLG